jgi:phosphatidylglycerophosphatase A
MGRAARAVASVGGIGLVRVAPGTAGSLAAVAFGAVLMRWSPAALPVAVVASVPVGWLAVRGLEEASEDPGWVVIDEVAGQWIAMLGLGRGAGWRGLVAAFALFRLFDIAKPGPVGWADRRKGAGGVMLDDVLAGGMAALLLVSARRVGRRR